MGDFLFLWQAYLIYKSVEGRIVGSIYGGGDLSINICATTIHGVQHTYKC